MFITLKSPTLLAPQIISLEVSEKNRQSLESAHFKMTVHGSGYNYMVTDGFHGLSKGRYLVFLCKGCWVLSSLSSGSSQKPDLS